MESQDDAKAVLRTASTTSVKAQLGKTLQETGELVIDAGTVKALQQETGISSAPAAVAAMPKTSGTEDIVAPVPVAANEDVLMQDNAADKAELVVPGFLAEKLTITTIEKEAFLDAVTTDSRFVQPFSLYGGAVQGIFQSRTVREHSAILAYLGKLLREKAITTDDEYLRHLKALVLTAQVQRWRSLEFQGMTEPAFETVTKTGVQDPAWLPVYQMWLDLDNKQPGITSPLFGELQKFERKYWTLIGCADDPNFWSPAEAF